MSQLETGVFAPSSANTVRERVREQVMLPRSQEQAVDRVREELAVRDLVARWAFSLDDNDAEAITGCFTADGIMTNPRGTSQGADAIRASLQDHFGDSRRFHVWSNLVVRLSDDLQHGRVTSNFYGMTQVIGSPARMVGGLAVHDVAKHGGEWKITRYEASPSLAAHLNES